jgi:hypothetical protein
MEKNHKICEETIQFDAGKAELYAINDGMEIANALYFSGVE